MAEKRNRGKNFSNEEKDKLLKLLSQCRQTILNKKTDGTTNEAKLLAWTSLASRFNSSGNTFRTKDSLMKLWEKLKSEAKIYHGKNKKGLTGTGGGPSTVKYDPILEQVCNILGRGCTGILEVKDSDAVAVDVSDAESVYIATKPKTIDIDSVQEIYDLNASSSLNDFIIHTEANINSVNVHQEPEIQVIPQEGAEVQLNNENIQAEAVTENVTPLWSRRRRPQLNAMQHERADALASISSIFSVVQQRKIDYENLKIKILEEEGKFKRQINEKQLAVVTKELEIKTEILKQIKDGRIALGNMFGGKKDGKDTE